VSGITSRDLARVAALAVGYFIGGQIGLLFSYGDNLASLVWPPAGIALAAILLGGYRLWPGVVLGATALAVANGAPFLAAVLGAVGNTVAALTAAWLLRVWLDFDLRLHRVRDALALAGVGAMLPAVISASVGALFLYASGSIGPPALGTGWAVWWLGDVAGVLLVAPMLLAWGADWGSRPWRSPPGEVAAVFLALGLACAVSFGGLLQLERSDLPLAFLLFPFLIWVALRLPMPWVATASLLAVGAALVGTASGYGPFAQLGPVEGAAVLWLFMAMVTLTMLLVGAGMSERRRAERRWVHAVESNPSAMLLVNHAGRIALVNAQAERIFATHRRELVGKPVELLIPERFRSGHEMFRAGYTGDPGIRPMGGGRDLWALRRDGTEFPVEVGLAAIETDEGMLTITAVSDITGRKQAELALREERNFVSAVLGTVQALVVVADVDGRIVRFNKACEETSGYTFDEVKGRPLWELFHPADSVAQVRRGMSELQSGRFPTHFEQRWRTKEGPPRLITWSNTVLRGPDGAIRYLVGTGVDITEQRRAEEQAVQRQAALAHIDRLTAAGELAASLAHELNQPLSAITSYCDTALALMETPDASADVVYALDQACVQAERASAIIRHLRAFVQKGTTRRAWADLNGIINDSVRFVETEARHLGVKLRVELEEDLPPLMLDGVQIEQVLVNLMRNSFEAMAAATSAVREVLIRSQCPTPGGRVQVTVHDTGPGLPSTGAERLFEIFESTKPDGLGLGLSISRSIVEAHGGRLWADPGAGAGASFSFTLPTVAEETHGTATTDRVPG
jgi:two-component system, LuxR family, sensor kinase FixL